MWKITKDFDFCYGHRVHNQKLNSELSLDSCLACRHLHGHQGRVRVSLAAAELDHGMVTDFKHLNWFKKFVDDYLDHKFIIDKEDPYLATLLFRIKNPERPLWIIYKEGHNTLFPTEYDSLPYYEKEILEGLVIVPFVPTSENLSRWLHDIIVEKMPGYDATIEFYETPKSSSYYVNQ